MIPKLRALTENCANLVGQFAALRPWDRMKFAVNQ